MSRRQANRVRAHSPQTGPLPDGIPLRELLTLSSLRGVNVLAGDAGLDRVVKSLNVMTRPEILPWVRNSELLLTTGYPLSASVDIAELVCAFDAHDLAGFGIKFDEYVDQLPDRVLQSATERGFPILDIPHEVRLDDILSQVLTDIANHQASLLSRSDEIHKVLMETVLSGGELAEITARLANLLGSSVAALDRNGEILAQTNLANASEYLTAKGLSDGTCLPVDEAVHLQSYSDTRVAVVPISVGLLRYGYMVAVGLQHSLPKDTTVVLERGATVAALEVMKRQAVTAVEQKHQSDFLHDLLVGRQDEQHDVERRAKILGWNLSRPVVVVVAESQASSTSAGDIEPPRDDFWHSQLADRWTSAVRARDPEAATAVYSDECIAIVGAMDVDGILIDTRRIAEEVAAELAHVAVPGTLSCGISSTASSVCELSEAYKQASRALKVGREMPGAGTVTSFNGLGVFRILSLVDKTDELFDFVSDMLGPILRLKVEERDELLRTLAVLIDCNLNIKVAAPILHFHYNTIRYRVAKLERLVGRFTTDRHLCHRLSLALQVVQLHGHPRDIDVPGSA